MVSFMAAIFATMSVRAAGPPVLQGLVNKGNDDDGVSVHNLLLYLLVGRLEREPLRGDWDEVALALVACGPVLCIVILPKRLLEEATAGRGERVEGGTCGKWGI